MDDHTLPPQHPHTNTSAEQQQGSTSVAQPQSSTQVVGSMHKEAGPTRVEAPLSEVMMPSEKAPELPKEVEDAGVEVSKNHEAPPDLTMHDKKLIDHAPVIAPVPTQPSGMVELPMTEQKAVETLKTNNNPKNSIAWLATSVLRQIKMKLAGGH